LVVLHKFEEANLNKLYFKEMKASLEELKKKINSRSIYPLNIIYVNEEEFKYKKDYLLEQAKETGFCIYNHQNYYKKIFE